MTIEPISLHVYFRFIPVISIAIINYLCPARSVFFQLANPFPEAFVSRFLVRCVHIYMLEKALLRQVHVPKKYRLAPARFASGRTQALRGGGTNVVLTCIPNLQYTRYSTPDYQKCSTPSSRPPRLPSLMAISTPSKYAR